MENQTIISIETVIAYIEDHLDGKLELDMVANAVHYSKYHLHRMFTATGYRHELIQLGFAERELLVEYGYPTQRFVLPPQNEEEGIYEKHD